MTTEETTSGLRKILPQQGWTPSYWEVSQLNSLSLRALGLHTYLLSLPEGWKISSSRISKARKEGREAIRVAMAELKTHGLLQQEKQRNPQGQLSTVCNLYAVPQQQEAPGPRNPYAGEPEAGNLGPIRRDTHTRDIQEDIKDQDLKTPVRTNGSVGTREDRDGGEEIFTQQADDEHSATVNVTKVQNLKSAPTGVEGSVEGQPRLRLVGAGVEDLKPKFPKPRTSMMQDTKQYRLTVDAFQIFDWQISPLNVKYALYSLEDGCGYFNTDGERVNCYGVLMPDPDYRPSQDEIREHAECYMGQGASERFAWDQARRDFMSPAQREAVDFLNSIELELSDDEKREFYPQVTELFKRPWGSGDLAQKLCSGLQGFGSPVSGFRKRLKGLAGGSGGLAAA